MTHPFREGEAAALQFWSDSMHYEAREVTTVRDVKPVAPVNPYPEGSTDAVAWADGYVNRSTLDTVKRELVRNVNQALVVARAAHMLETPATCAVAVSRAWSTAIHAAKTAVDADR